MGFCIVVVNPCYLTYSQVENEEPDETGAHFQRPGRLYDYVPGPYPNEEAARHANNGAYPPDLSLICLARKGGANYIFALLTGYTDPPAGVEVQEGQHFNPYFAGGAISMAQSIYNEVRTCSPTCHHYVCSFLIFLSLSLSNSRRRWTSQMEHQHRHHKSLRMCAISSNGLDNRMLINVENCSLNCV